MGTKVVDFGSSGIPQSIRRGNHPSNGRCLLPVNLPCFLIFLREHHGREGHGGIASYQIGKRVSFLTQATRCYTDTKNISARKRYHAYAQQKISIKSKP